MALPSNLIPTSTSQISQPLAGQLPQATLPSNLIPINASQISQPLAGELPQLDLVEIPEYSILNQALPDSKFTTGSVDQVRERALATAEQFIRLSAPAIPVIFSIPTGVPRFSPKLPTFGQIKNFINTKIARIKRERQKASIKTLKQELKEREDPFAYRQMLKNKSQPRG